MDKSYIIRSVAIDVTNNCNLRCLHCYNFSGEHENRENEMSYEELLKIFKEVCNYQPDSICICGGEPLIKVNLVYRICDLVKKINPNIALNMVSNGFLLNDEIANNLKEKGLDTLQISLDGLSASSHNWIRNNKYAYEKAICAINTAIKAGLTVNVACCPTKVNFEEISGLIQECKKMGVSMVRFQPLMIMGRGTELKKYALSDEKYMELAHIIRQQNKNKKIDIEWGDPTEHLVNIFYEKRKETYIDISITAYGDIMVSPYIPIKVGNVRNKTIKEYLDNGLQNIYLDGFIKKVVSMVTDWNAMNLSETSNLFPRLGIEKNINYDILDKDNNDFSIINQIMEIDEI